MIVIPVTGGLVMMTGNYRSGAKFEYWTELMNDPQQGFMLAANIKNVGQFHVIPCAFEGLDAHLGYASPYSSRCPTCGIYFRRSGGGLLYHTCRTCDLMHVIVPLPGHLMDALESFIPHNRWTFPAKF